MFGKRNPPNAGPNAGADNSDDGAKRRAAEALERARAERPKGASRLVGAAAADQPRQPGSYSLPGSARAQPGPPGARPKGEGRTLVVGRDISLSGEIKACEQLIVEGQVSANLEDCKILQISASGLYKGAAGVDRAEISGRFEGELTVKGTLILHATGRVSGTLRYGDMEIERGGKIVGTLEEFPPAGASAPDSAEDRPKAAGKTRSAASLTKAKDLRVQTTVS